MNSLSSSGRRSVFLLFLSLLALLAFTRRAVAQTPPQSTFFSTVAEEAYSTYLTPNGNGDLWPSCWSNDGNLYAANGDGTGFGGSNVAMKVSSIAGTPPNLTGTTVYGDAGRDYTGMPYNGSTGYTDKPTGMLCLNGALYLAFQNLNEKDFEYAPAASIVMSTNHGATWSTPSSTPMFGSANNTNESVAALFTTILFLDFGQDSANAVDGYVYAYGLDQTWRDQQAVFLARVPSNAVLTRSAWQFYSGTNPASPTWSSDITQKQPVIRDTRLLYPTMFGTDCPSSDKVIAQGGAVYDAPLHRYLFTSWSCSTHELYEAPQPWGPWSHIAAGTFGSTVAPATADFGPLRGANNRGQYGTSIPSKFISSDGLSMYLQSNVCCSGDPAYTFALRKLSFTAAGTASAGNTASNTDLALAPGARAISKSTHYGTLCGANCTDQLSSGSSRSEDDYDEESKTSDWWGYTWPQPYNIDTVTYRTGTMFSNGGWYAGNLRVQVRRNFQWTDVSSTISPAYPYSNAAGSQTTYTLTFPATTGDGVRIIGTLGAPAYFSSINQLSVTYGATTNGLNLIQDPGFEQQTSSSLSSPWTVEGPDAHGVDLSAGFAHSGVNNAWIRDSTTNWNAISQIIPVQPNTNYTLTGWMLNNFSSNTVYFGASNTAGTTHTEKTYNAAPNYTAMSVSFNSGSNTAMRIYCGFYGNGTDQFLRLDDVAVH